MTRARDHLALAVTGANQAWLEELTGNDGSPLLVLEGENLRIGAHRFPIRLAPEPNEPPATAAAPPEYARPSVACVAHPRLRLSPLSATNAGRLAVGDTQKPRTTMAPVGTPSLPAPGAAPP